MQEFFELMMRHWNPAAAALNSGDPFLPFLPEDDAGFARANDWAQGFTRGMKLRSEDWADLLGDEAHGRLVVPILALAHEHDPDTTLRPYKEPMDAERREQLIVGVAASVPPIYRYFASRRRATSRAERGNTTHRRAGPKIGRNDPCPGGSGKKFKKCCGQATLH